MARKGNSIIKGIEINEIITMLNKAYADEWLAYYQYFIEAKVIKGIMKDAAIAVLGNDYTLIAPIIDRMDIITTMFIAWCTFTVSLAGTVIVVRETFKIRKMTSLNYERRDNTEIIERIRP